jgi:hypothetical protein
MIKIRNLNVYIETGFLNKQKISRWIKGRRIFIPYIKRLDIVGKIKFDEIVYCTRPESIGKRYSG